MDPREQNHVVGLDSKALPAGPSHRSMLWFLLTNETEGDIILLGLGICNGSHQSLSSS